MPGAGSVRIAQVEGLGAYVCGEYTAHGEVFVPYYDSIRRSDLVAPHIQFARCNGDPDSIVSFTKRWGPLRPNPPFNRASQDWLLCHAFPDESEPSPEIYFALWNGMRSQFNDVLRLLASPRASERRRVQTMWPHWTLATVQSGGLRIEPDFGTPLRELFHLWKKTSAVASLAKAKELARRLGIFAPDVQGQVCFKLVATTLWDSLWLMLALDHSVRRAVISYCANDKCQQAFVRDRLNKQFCGADCAQRQSSLRYYHRTGKERRQMRTTRE
jgi:hypothetical protein